LLQDNLFRAPFGRNLSAGQLYGNNFAPIYSGEFFGQFDSTPLGFSIYITGDVGSNTFIDEASLGLDVGLGGYISSYTATSGFLTDSFSDWLYYSQATPINPTGNTLNKIPVLLDLNEITGLWAYAKSDLSDVRVALSDGTPVPFHIVSYDFANQSGLMVLNITKTTGNQSVRVYYGNSEANALQPTDTYGQYNTYNTGIFAFYPSGIGQDATSNARHLASSGTITKTAGPIGNAAAAYAPNAAGTVTGSFSTNGMTIQGWGSVVNAGVNHTIATVLNSGTIFDYHWAAFLNGVGGSPFSALSNQVGQGQTRSDTPNAMPLATWSHGLATYSGTSYRKAYLSGVGSTPDTLARTPGTANAIYLGANPSQASYMNGSLSLVFIYGYPVADNEATYYYSMGNQTTFWGGFTHSSNSQGGGGGPEGVSVLLTGLSNVLTYSFGDFYRSYPLAGSGLSNTSSSGQIRNLVDFRSSSNNYTSSSGNLIDNNSLAGFSFTVTQEIGDIRNSLGFLGQSNSRTDDSGNINALIRFNSSSNSTTSVTSNILSNLGFIASSNSTTSTSGGIRYNLGLLGSSNSRTDEYGILGNTVNFAGQSNSQTTESGNLVNRLGFIGVVNSYTSFTGGINNNASFRGESLSRTDDFGTLRSNLGFAGDINSRTIEFGSLINNISFAGQDSSVTQTVGNINTIINISFAGDSWSTTAGIGSMNVGLGFAGSSNSVTSTSGVFRNNLGFAGTSSSTTSESLDIRISRALSALSVSITNASADLNLQGVVTLAGIIASNTSSNATLNMLLVLNATIQAATILQNAGINVNRMLQATSSSTTRALADVKKAISLGGDVGSITSASCQAQVNILLNGISSAITQLSGNLTTQGQVTLAGVVNVLSQVSGFVSISLDFGASVLSNTFSVGDLGISQAVLLAVQDAVRSSSSGAILKTIVLDSESSTDTEIRGTINLDVSLGSIVEVLTGLSGTLEAEGILGTGETIRFSVYLMMNRELSLDIQRSYNQSIPLVGR
jgi:hypothetical protein